MNLNNDIKTLKLKWKTWAEEKCKGMENKSYMKDSYYHFAATMCIDAIRKLIKKEKNDSSDI